MEWALGNFLYGRAHDSVKVEGDRVNFWEVGSWFFCIEPKEWMIFKKLQGKGEICGRWWEEIMMASKEIFPNKTENMLRNRGILFLLLYNFCNL